MLLRLKEKSKFSWFKEVTCTGNLPDVKETHGNMKILFDLNDKPFIFPTDCMLLLITLGKQMATTTIHVHIVIFSLEIRVHIPT